MSLDRGYLVIVYSKDRGWWILSASGLAYFNLSSYFLQRGQTTQDRLTRCWRPWGSFGQTSWTSFWKEDKCFLGIANQQLEIVWQAWPRCEWRSNYRWRLCALRWMSTYCTGTNRAYAPDQRVQMKCARSDAPNGGKKNWENLQHQRLQTSFWRRFQNNWSRSTKVGRNADSGDETL